MPQLMPFFWIISIFMVIFFMMVMMFMYNMIVNYFYFELISMYNESNFFLKW